MNGLRKPHAQMKSLLDPAPSLNGLSAGNVPSRFARPTFEAREVRLASTPVPLPRSPMAQYSFPSGPMPMPPPSWLFPAVGSPDMITV